MLSIGEIESRLTAQGIKVKEIEVRDLLAEVEGYDAQGREVELVIDRRSGETLSHKYDDDHKEAQVTAAKGTDLFSAERKN